MARADPPRSPLGLGHRAEFSARSCSPSARTLTAATSVRADARNQGAPASSARMLTPRPAPPCSLARSPARSLARCTFARSVHFFTGVPGGPYPILLARSVDFDPYFAVLKARYPNPPDRILLLSMIGLVWDRAEPGGYMRTGSSAHAEARQWGPQAELGPLSFSGGAGASCRLAQQRREPSARHHAQQVRLHRLRPGRWYAVLASPHILTCVGTDALFWRFVVERFCSASVVPWRLLHGAQHRC